MQVLGKSLADFCLRLNKRIWQRLFFRVRNLYPVRCYGMWLHTLVCLRASRQHILALSGARIDVPPGAAEGPRLAFEYGRVGLQYWSRGLFNPLDHPLRKTGAHERRTDQRRSVVDGKVLLLSERRIANLVAFCLAYEFEDTFAAVTVAERIDVTDLPGLEFSRRAYKLVRGASGSPRLARRLAPYPRNKVVLDQDFDLFFPVFSHIYELYSLATIPELAPAVPQGGLLHHRGVVGSVTGISARALVCSLTTSSSGSVTVSKT